MKREKNEEYKESQITAIDIFCFTFYIKNYILLESIVYTVTLIYAGYLKWSNDTPHIFISMGYLILMPEKYLHFRKRC